MSYCVNCGVRLAKSEHACPLCNTKVINPNKLEEDYVPAYSSQIEKFKTIKITVQPQGENSEELTFNNIPIDWQ